MFKISTPSSIFGFIWCQEAMLNYARFSIQKEVICGVPILASIKEPWDISFGMPTWDAAELDTNLVTFKKLALFQYLSPSLSHRKGWHMCISGKNEWQFVLVRNVFRKSNTICLKTFIFNTVAESWIQSILKRESIMLVKNE